MYVWKLHALPNNYFMILMTFVRFLPILSTTESMLLPASRVLLHAFWEL